MNQLETGEAPEAAQAVSDLQNEAERQHGQLTELAHANRVATLGQPRPRLPMNLNSRSARCSPMPKPLWAC
jgi:hypothetical protein